MPFIYQIKCSSFNQDPVRVRNHASNLDMENVIGRIVNCKRHLTIKRAKRGFKGVHKHQMPKAATTTDGERVNNERAGVLEEDHHNHLLTHTH